MQRKGFLIDKAFNKYLWASIFTVAASQVANIIDASLVGNIIGADGLAAVVISKPVIQAIFAFSCLYVSGCAMMTGMSLGKGDRAKANHLFSFCLAVSIISGLAMIFGGVAFIDPLLDVFCQSEKLRPMARPFMLITILSALPQLVMFTLQQFVSIDGSPKLITKAVIVGNIANIAMDIVLMKYMGMGIAGAAWATLVMYVVVCLIVCLHFRREGTLRLSFLQIRQYVSPREILVLGTPVFLSTVLLSVQFACFNYIATTYLGNNGLIVLAVCIQLLAFSMIILSGVLRTIQPVGAILKGIDDSGGMMLLMKRAYRFMTISLAVFTLAIVLFPDQITGLLGVQEASALSLARTALPAFSLNIIMQALLYNLMPVYQFYGHHRLALFLSVGQTLLPIAGFWLLSAFSPQVLPDDSQLTTLIPWLGFFLGQLITAVVILISSAIIRRKENATPIFLIPRNTVTSLEFSYGYSDEDLHQSFDEMSAWLKQQDLSQSVVFKVRIIAEELMSNITRHSGQKDSKAFADVRIAIQPEAVVFSLTDDGSPFSPIENKDKGYGLQIANGAASDISYKYQFGQNMTTVKVNRHS